MLFKTLILVNLGLILLSLASGVFFLAKDGGKDRRLIASLTFRIVLSFTLIGLLIVGYYTGAISPHAL